MEGDSLKVKYGRAASRWVCQVMTEIKTDTIETKAKIAVDIVIKMPDQLRFFRSQDIASPYSDVSVDYIY